MSDSGYVEALQLENKRLRAKLKELRAVLGAMNGPASAQLRAAELDRARRRSS